MAQCVQSTLIYRLKREPEEEAAKMSASALALCLNLTYYSPQELEMHLLDYFCYQNMQQEREMKMLVALVLVWSTENTMESKPGCFLKHFYKLFYELKTFCLEVVTM